MKCLYPPFPAMIGSHVIWWNCGLRSLPADSKRRIPLAATPATSCSSSKRIDRVQGSTAGNSDATNPPPPTRPSRLGPPVGRTTCVTETELSGHRLLDEKILEVFQLAGRSANLKLLIVDNGYTGGVIAAVFE